MKIFPIDPAVIDKADVAELPELLRQFNAVPLIALDFSAAAKLSGLSRAWLYRDARVGKLRVLKAGARSLILYNDLLGYMQSLPAARFRPFPDTEENKASLAASVKSASNVEDETHGSETVGAPTQVSGS
jgi:hypothetical protein